MEEILYVKIAQNIPVAKRQVTFHDLATLHCTNKKVVQELNQMVFYTLPAHGPQKTMFTIAKVYEVIHQKYPNLKIENLGERDFVIDYEKPDEKEKQKKWEYVRTIFVSFIVFMGAAFTIMTFNEDVSVADVFDKVYRLVLGQEKQGGSIIEICYAIGLPVGILVFYNHFRRRKIKDDPTPIQVEMHTYEEQVNKTLIAAASKEGKTIDSDSV